MIEANEYASLQYVDCTINTVKLQIQVGRNGMLCVFVYFIRKRRVCCSSLDTEVWCYVYILGTSFNKYLYAITFL
jgi:hypothetical protein